MLCSSRKFGVALVCAALCLAGPASALDQVPGKASSTPAAAQAQQSGAAVVDKGLTTATITVPPSSEPQEFEIPLKPLIEGLLPYIISGFGAIITLLISTLSVWVKRKWNIDIDQQHRDAWQTAAANAAGALIARGAVKIEDATTGKVTVKSEALAQAINTVAARVPDAMKHFGFSEDNIRSLILAKIPQVMPAPATKA